jgi:hypothetical protein
MKYLSLIYVLSLLISALVAANTPVKNQITIYYFHGYMRCNTCYKMEQYTKEAVQNYFKKEIETGKIVFKVINYEEKGNEFYIDKYQLYTKSVIVSLSVNDKEIKYKNLDKIWDFVSNKEKFIEYIVNEVKEYLNEL